MHSQASVCVLSGTCVVVLVVSVLGHEHMQAFACKNIEDGYGIKIASKLCLLPFWTSSRMHRYPCKNIRFSIAHACVSTADPPLPQPFPLSQCSWVYTNWNLLHMYKETYLCNNYIGISNMCLWRCWYMFPLMLASVGESCKIGEGKVLSAYNWNTRCDGNITAEVGVCLVRPHSYMPTVRYKFHNANILTF